MVRVRERRGWMKGCVGQGCEGQRGASRQEHAVKADGTGILWRHGGMGSRGHIETRV